LWFLPSERSLMGPLLLVDEGNPFVKMPARCTFESAAGRRTIDLSWVPIEGKALLAKLPPEAGGEAPGLRRVGDAFWPTIPTFNLGAPKSSAPLKSLTREGRSQPSMHGS